MFRVIIQVRDGRKKVSFTVYGIMIIEINQDERGSGKGDMWIYLDNKNKKYKKDLLLTYCIKAKRKPVIIGSTASELDFRHTDDIITKYVF